MDIAALGNFIDKYGLPIIEIIVGGWVIREVIVKALWPYFIDSQKQTRADRDQERKDRIAERDLFLASLGALNATMISRDAMLRDNMEALLKVLQGISGQLKQIDRRRLQIAEREK